MTSEQVERRATVNFEIEGEVFDRVELTMKAFDWSRTNAVKNALRRGLDLPTPMDRAPDARLDGEGN